MIGPPSHVAVGTACDVLGLGVSQLWFDTIALGASTMVTDLRTFIAGHSEISDLEYDIVAQALNERFMDLGEDHPVPYAAQL